MWNILNKKLNNIMLKMSEYSKYVKYKTKYLKLKKRYIFSTNMETAINSLMNSDETSVFIDTYLDKKDQKSIDSLFSKEDITNNEFSYCGIFDATSLGHKIDVFFEQITDDKNSMHLTRIINRIIDVYTKATKNDYIWINIRLQYPTPDYDIPRWHADGYYYNPEEYSKKKIPQIKLAGVLKGPPTLFKSGDQNIFSKWSQLRRKLYKDFDYKNYDKKRDMENRKIIDDELKEYQMVIAKKNEVAIFKAGHNGAIHSEPSINTKRVFYSILTGNREEILDWATSQKKIFNDKK